MTPKNKQKMHGGRNHRNLVSKDSPLDEYVAKYHSQPECDPIESAEYEFYRVCNKYGPKQEERQDTEIPNRGEMQHSSPRPSPLGSPGPIEAFFTGYTPRFQYNPTASSSLEFYRLCDELGWDKKHPERQRAHEAFDDALVLQFNKIYGMDVDNLKIWQKLCRAMRIRPVPDDLHACREAVRGSFVNLVDLVDTKNTGAKVERFKTERQLNEYTLSTGKVFPKENARAGGVLQYLMQPVFFPFGVGPASFGSHWGAMGRR